MFTGTAHVPILVARPGDEFTFFGINIKRRPATRQCLHLHPPWDLGRPGRGCTAAARLSRACLRGQLASHGTREPTSPRGGAMQEDLVAGSQRVYRRSACRSCFVGTECSRPLRRGPGPARGAQGLLGWGLHSGCPFALPLNSLHFSHEQTVRA